MDTIEVDGHEYEPCDEFDAPICPVCEGPLSADDFGSTIQTQQWRSNYLAGECPGCKTDLRAEEAGGGWELAECRIVPAPELSEYGDR